MVPLLRRERSVVDSRYWFARAASSAKAAGQRQARVALRHMIASSLVRGPAKEAPQTTLKQEVPGHCAVCAARGRCGLRHCRMMRWVCCLPVLFTAVEGELCDSPHSASVLYVVRPVACGGLVALPTLAFRWAACLCSFAEGFQCLCALGPRSACSTLFEETQSGHL